MLYQNGKKKLDYKRPEPLNSMNKNNLSVIMSVYSENDNGIFDSEKLTLRTIPFKDLFCKVNLSLIDDKLSLSQEEKTALDKNIATFFAKKNESLSLLQTRRRRVHAQILLLIVKMSMEV